MELDNELPTGAELDLLLGADMPSDQGADQGTGDTGTIQVAEGVTTPTPPAEQQSQWNPDGPGDPARALSEKNREISEKNQQMQQMQQQMLQMQQVLSDPQALLQYAAQVQQQQEQQRQSQQRRQVDFSVLDQLDPVTDPDGTFAALKGLIVQQHQQIEELRTGIAQTGHESRFTLARETARQRYQDYDAVVRRLEPFEHMLNPEVFLGPNGPETAYAFAKTLPPSPGEQQAPQGQTVQQQVQQQVTETARRLLPTPPTTPPSLSRMPAVAPNNDARGDLASVTPDQIDKAGVYNWYDAAIRSVS